MDLSSEYFEYYNKKYGPDHLDVEESSNSFEKISRIIPQNIEGSKVLDIGCGAGSISSPLIQKGVIVYGMDIMHEAAKRALNKGISVSLGDAHFLPFKDDSFDGIICLDVIEHLFNPYAFMKEVKRVMKDDGYFILEVPNHFNIIQRINTLKGHGIIHHTHRHFEKLTDVWVYPHIRFPTINEIYKFVSGTGFEIDKCICVQLKPWDFSKYNFVFQKYRVREKAAYKWPSLFANSLKLRLRLK